MNKFNYKPYIQSVLKKFPESNTTTIIKELEKRGILITYEGLADRLVGFPYIDKNMGKVWGLKITGGSAKRTQFDKIERFYFPIS